MYGHQCSDLFWLALGYFWVVRKIPDGPPPQSSVADVVSKSADLNFKVHVWTVLAHKGGAKRNCHCEKDCHLSLWLRKRAANGTIGRRDAVTRPASRRTLTPSVPCISVERLHVVPPMVMQPVPPPQNGKFDREMRFCSLDVTSLSLVRADCVIRF